MARTGRPPKPLEQKIALGNPGKRPLARPVTTIEPVVLTAPLSPPAASGHELVEALMEAGAAAWIGKTDQLATLQLVLDAWDARAHLRAVLQEQGWSYESFSEKGGSRWYPRPEAKQLDELEKRLTIWLSQLGLNPADRGRLGLAEVKARSKLEEMRDRRASRLAGLPAG